MPDLFFESVHTGRRYKIQSFDRENGTVTLIGSLNAPFIQKYSKEHFIEMGYKLVQEEGSAGAPPPPAAAAPPPPPPVSQPAAS